MAPRACEHQFFRPPRAGNHARNLAILRRAFPSSPRRHPLRVASVSPQKTRGISLAIALLHLLTLFANHRLQGPSHALAVSAILRRPARSFVRNHICRFSPALFDQHAAFLASRAALPLRRAQRRDQYDCLEPPLAARQSRRNPLAAHGGTVVPPPRRKRQRFRQFRQRVRASAPRGLSSDEAMLAMVP